MLLPYFATLSLKSSGIVFIKSVLEGQDSKISGFMRLLVIVWKMVMVFMCAYRNVDIYFITCQKFKKETVLTISFTDLNYF
jgi:hypothetical protein